ncbi:hypothetical protein HAX54_050989 [Datura stramonium]|uniref:Uncharacterized protein n=1 Tax=Datura stramonium TaxID=4076 RepID=A0ABS8RHE8_DATST|nr:hypothetical protein [Datura stramonium]
MGQHDVQARQCRQCRDAMPAQRMEQSIAERQPRIIIKNLLRRARVKKGQNIGFGGLLTRFLRGHQIEEEEVDYIPVYDPRGVGLTKTKKPEGVHGLVLSINEHNAQTGNMLSHMYHMEMLQLRMNGVSKEKLQQLIMDYPLSEHL